MKKDNNKCIVVVPPLDELATTYELPIIDKKTNKTIKTLKQTIILELADGISLALEAREFKQYQDEIAKVKNFSKSQDKKFKEGVLRLAQNKNFSPEGLVQLIRNIITKKQDDFRMSGHLRDLTLRTEEQEQKIFGDLSDKVKNKVEEFKLSKVFGIKLTPAEDKVITALCKILHDKSENKDINSNSFYTGNISLAQYKKKKSSVIRMKPSELYREYHGSNDYSGKDVTNINNILTELSEKKTLIYYTRQFTVKNGRKTEKLTDRIETVESLITIASYFENMTEKEVKELDSNVEFRKNKQDLIIALNPIFTDQIDSKYIEYPSDINTRTAVVSGGKSKVTKSIISLRDYMLRELSAKRYSPEINEEKLISQLHLTKYATSGRKKRVDNAISNAISACKNLGLIIDVKITTGAKNQIKYIFKLNQKFK